MDEKFNTILSIVLIPQTVDIIVQKENMDDLSAVRAFYRSRVYDFLTQEETKLWHFSPMTLYNMWKHEKETGNVLFPEE